ncbi:MAG: prepilin-type N-terminal cleavage/methylation domain-containing protein [Verrucomicrobiota bacterium]
MNLPSNNPHPWSFRRGFTIIELLTVVMCITVLMSITIPIASALQNKAYRTRTKAQFSQWGTAMEMFRAEYGSYPILWGSSTKDTTPPNVISTDRFAVALTGRHADGNSSDLRQAKAKASDLYGNSRLLSFYTFAGNEISRDDEKKPLLMDAFGNTVIAVLLDKNLDGFINTVDSNTYPAVADQFGGTYDPMANGDIPVKGLRAGVLFYSAGAGNPHGTVVESKAAVTNWDLDPK